eukprot:COSAG01_NODE_4312_length_5142_cov_2.895697_7_plen_141_part_00
MAVSRLRCASWLRARTRKRGQFGYGRVFSVTAGAAGAGAAVSCHTFAEARHDDGDDAAQQLLRACAAGDGGRAVGLLRGGRGGSGALAAAALAADVCCCQDSARRTPLSHAADKGLSDVSSSTASWTPHVPHLYSGCRCG